MENKIQKGAFWLPCSPNNQILGELSEICDSEYILTIYGNLDKSKSKAEYFNDHCNSMCHELVIGYLHSCEGVALVNTGFNKISLSPEIVFTYSIDIVIFTDQVIIKSLNDLVFDKVTLSYPYLHRYFGMCKISNSHGKENEKYALSYEVEKIPLAIDNGYQIEICKGFSWKCDFGEHVEISPKTSLKLEVPQRHRIIDLIDFIYLHISTLFTIIIGKFQCPIDLLAEYFLDGKTNTFKIYYRYFNLRETEVLNKRNSLAEIQQYLPLILKEFNEFAGKYPHLVQNYMVLYRFKNIPEFSFLSAVYSLETFSRYVSEDHYFYNDKTFFQKQYMDPITAFIDELYKSQDNDDYIQRLKTSIQYSNEVSLRAIVRCVLELYSEIFEKLFEYRQSELVNSVVVTRNWYTHYNSNDEKDAARGRSLFEITNKVRSMFEVCLFKRIGIPDELIIRILKTSYYYKPLLGS